jgi:iron complex transport system substrate-binding protein
LRDPGFYQELRAFREGRVYGLLPFNYYATNYELVFADAYFVGKLLFPDRFRDVDPAAKADEIMRVFVGKGLYKELEEHYGGFVRLDLASLAGTGR